MRKSKQPESQRLASRLVILLEDYLRCKPGTLLFAERKTTTKQNRASDRLPYNAISFTETEKVEMRELLVVEGESAANAIRRCSLPSGTTIVCLQGKPPNVQGLGRSAVQANPFLQAIVSELNGGWESLDQAIGSRFDQVGLVMDPDADGMHCSLLLLWFFRQYMASWLESGRIFQVILPRFEIRVQGESLQHYAFTESGAERLANQLRAKRLPGQVRVAKVRGIAALPADLLQDYCLHSPRRKKTVLTMQDADRGWNRS